MEKIVIILLSIWTHRNQVVFRKIKHNPFLIIKVKNIVSTDILVLGFYRYIGYIGEISVDIFI